jgi:hypothetical protein
MSEWRKLISQMNIKEIRKLYNLIHTHQYEYTNYSCSRLAERNICESDVKNTIKYGTIIEFHFKNGESRVLIRNIQKVNYQSICVVVNLTTNVITTVYKNDYRDMHETLHNELYDSEIDLMKYIN